MKFISSSRESASYSQQRVADSIPSRLLFLSIAILFAIGVLFSDESLAQERKTIEVIGTGSASAKVDMIEITSSIKAHGDTTKELLKEFMIQKTALSEAVNPMDLPGVSVVYGDPELSAGQSAEGPVMMMGGMVEEEDKPDLGFDLNQSATIRVKVAELGSIAEKLDAVSKAIDIAKTNNAVFGAEINVFHYTGDEDYSILKTIPKDEKALVVQAEKDAFKNGKETAMRLAELAGGSIGQVVSITAVSSAETNHFGIEQSSASKSLDDVTVKRSFRLVFELK